ncbi:MULTISPECIES: bifunctional DNA-formamidopyrimidine glycosylase/DNA-(apurinic or apyrimidinic site) lyase [Micromonospora]|uniref:Formamidopyrimidine-DNA glycosylase n=1 Tax=Micromonospora solifontis TaxID=2487138 RepID=A0ABX9WAT3_9ACTN|nr:MULTISPECIES: bifunctional DNA-formamidopyrimidine glycosylase/DNA-(apurinic or apyrimidinic site) lyase [Micromonospora]NES14016.1 bifunctional DNA-formamidopyrimidine glycosylase/DNA-(apurinic or apyrimidinic site) lyase [Micromonospora sp. PPF5-17B]NES38900.1 bifunctional DNA-formamidopyrimidine glycosylase/DNA-(apurinic or apyrimidinic site) lyase [Micromonospora solifontis]NES58809.1 bifunctional DNA-formamidopyrimidine glycosylase/DNA-(apurinic or apyrimidinic site) lyase [Micromonospor
MPELPEVETVRQGLAQWVTGRTISSVEVRHPRAIRRHEPGAAHFADVLTGRTITDVRRRGKYLWLPLDSGDALIGHLGMSGQLLLQPVGAADELHLRVRFRFADDGPELRFVDQRTFGGLSVSEGGAELPAEIAHIARDPMDPRFSDADFVAALRRKRTEIKRALLDQTLISGVGNIYADEALWRAKLHGARPTDALTGPAASRLLGHVRDVLGEAIKQGGTSFDELYVDVNGESGYFDRSLNAYGREGEPCPRCGAPIRREAFMNRSSYSCPRCQPRPRGTLRG